MNRLIVWGTLSIFGLLMLADASMAGTWSSTYSMTYTMGERDSRSGLRRIALEEARMKASAEAGMAVLNEQRLKDDRLIEQTRLVSAAMIRLKILEEKPGVSEGNPIVQFEILAEVDDSELEKQLAAMRTDVRKNDRIAALSIENEGLRRRIDSLSAARSGTLEPSEKEAIDDSLESSWASMQAIQRRAYLALNGTELVGAAVEQAETESALIEGAIMRPLLRSRLNVEMKPWRKIGSAIEVPVALSWEFDVAGMKRAALQFSTPKGLPGMPHANGFCAGTESGSPGRQSSAGLQLLADGVAIEVTLGESKSYFLIGGEGDLGQFCVVAGSFSAPRTVLLSLPETKAQAVGSISVKTVRMSNVAAGWKSMVRNDLLTGGL